MARVDQSDGSNHRRLPSRRVRRNLEIRRHWLLCAMALATILGPGSAFAQSCTGLCTPQTADQVKLLSAFGTLLNSPAGLALLSANLKTDETIYLNSTPAQKVAAAEDALLQYTPINILITAFPTNPHFYYSQAGVPTATGLPASVTTAVSSSIRQRGAGLEGLLWPTRQCLRQRIQQLFGRPQRRPAALPGVGAIANNPFTPANSSVIAYQIQQTHVALGSGFANENWQSYTLSPAFPSGHSHAATSTRFPTPSLRRDIISSCRSPGWTSPTVSTSTACIIRWT